MAEITASLVKQLRDITSVGFGDCKKALTKTDGDIDAAIKVLRKEGQVKAVKKADRAANQGLVDAAVSDDVQTGTLIEVNCETDFVAKNEDFQAFVAGLAQQALQLGDGELAEAAKEEVGAQVIALGENLVVASNVRYQVQGTGAIAHYVHNGGQVGVLMELGFEKTETASHSALTQLGRDLCMQVAATNPLGLVRDDIDASVIEAERELFVKQAQEEVEGKPPEIAEKIVPKIVEGKVNKFYASICMVEQDFIKDGSQTITQLMQAVGKEVDDTLSIRRMLRFEIGG